MPAATESELLTAVLNVCSSTDNKTRRERADSHRNVKRMADITTIKVRPSGPYLVSVPVEIQDADGNVIPLPEGKPMVALCRCGASTSKPFCDGTHSKIGFDAAAKAVPGSSP